MTRDCPERSLSHRS